VTGGHRPEQRGELGAGGGKRVAAIEGGVARGQRGFEHGLGDRRGGQPANVRAAWIVELHEDDELWMFGGKQPDQSGDVLSERVYTPWPDMEAEMRAATLPLFSPESRHPIRDFDVVGFSLGYETVYTNVLTMLDLGGIALRVDKRGNHDQVIVARGHSGYNPEPMSPFIDALCIGEGEEAMPEMLARNAYIRYLVLGEGPEREGLEGRWAELSIEEMVIFAGTTAELPA